ncbi:oxalurate catabolism protein HpxZ [Rhizobium sp. S152]|uniref:oxalurate catabolism protein HpxZ n=1 Tax=Rhizobium sp. S152 TaxID=3055038 RepID=UPI0025AA073D|nr:oxalurate catabolism protein HpxZ [Rhizobium sp. S152]MDM9627870.1 oxalurate catabolism protein HpxZ [Rhizobium sp. S152]
MSNQSSGSAQPAEELNLPSVVAELTRVCDAYEQALMSNDLDTLDQLFWASPSTLRYGVSENLYGIDEIRSFRIGRSGGSPQREVLRRVITTYGQDFATCNLEFVRPATGTRGRQSQTWLRTREGWRIAAAHVSLMNTDR